MDAGAGPAKQQLAYVVFGREETFLEGRFSLVQAFARASEPPDVVIATDQPARFADLPVRTFTITPEIDRDWRGPDAFALRMKITALLTLMEQAERTILLDADTLLLADPAALFALIRPTHSIMQMDEGVLRTAPTHRKLSRLFLDGARAAGATLGFDSVATLSDSQHMWNSGVVGVHRSQRPVVERALRLCDELHTLTRWNYAEQFALSVLLEHETTLQSVEPMVEHYWSRIGYPGWNGGKSARQLYHEQASQFFAAHEGKSFYDMVASLRRVPPTLYNLDGFHRWLAAVLRRTIASPRLRSIHGKLPKARLPRSLRAEVSGTGADRSD